MEHTDVKRMLLCGEMGSYQQDCQQLRGRPLTLGQSVILLHIPFKIYPRPSSVASDGWGPACIRLRPHDIHAAVH